MTAAGPQDGFAALLRHLEARLVGREMLIRRLVTAFVAGGHVLIEGAPGLAKTRAVKALAEGVEARFSRIQATPDLLPADLTGTMIYRQDTGAFSFAPGPVFGDILLVDEVNRAPPKVQSALLEAMGEHQVTVGGETRPLPDLFTVVATQNPIEHEGTYPLPEAQLDRFLFLTEIGFPDAAMERAIIDLTEAEGDSPAPPPMRLDPALVLEARKAAAAVHLSPPVRDYIVRLVMATRGEGSGAVEAGVLEYPASPRGSLAMARAAKAGAWLAGRDYVVPDDVRELAADALAGRVGLTYRARARGLTARGVVEAVVDAVAVT